LFNFKGKPAILGMIKKTVLITGAAKRIGKFISLFLAKKGFNIAIHYNLSKKDAIDLQAELQNKYPEQKFEIFQCDLSNTLDCSGLINKVLLHFDRIDILVNNASVFEPGIIRETSIELFQNQMNVNLLAPFILSRDYAVNCKDGLIVNFLDTRISAYSNSHAAYSLSKVAFSHFTKMAALEFAPNIRVNGIAPGATLPPEDQGEEYLLNLAKKTPMQIPGGIEPVLQSMDYIIENKNLTGQILFCDGGEQLL
jgi:pteridine reductase